MGEDSNMKEKFKPLFLQFAKFLLVGLSNTGIYLLVYYAFLRLNSDWYMAGSVIGTILSIANAFIWNEHFVFTQNQRDWKARARRVVKTYISYGGTSVLSNILRLAVSSFPCSAFWLRSTIW